MKAIIFIIMSLTMLHAEFIKNGDIVTDTDTNLQWQDDAIGSETIWINAINKCESLSLGSYNDWRLPNINELKSIIHRSAETPAIVLGFDNTISDFYWSSTTYVDNKSFALYVKFVDGVVGIQSKDIIKYSRCVRDGN